MKKRITLVVATATVLGATILLTRPASAHDRLGGGRNGNRSQYTLVPDDLRDQFHLNLQNMSEEERLQLRNERRSKWTYHQKAIEEFTGLDIETIRERIKNGESLGDIISELGKTEEEAQAFLTQIGEDRVSHIVETHDLSEEDAQTLYQRVSDWVENILSRWFNTTN